MKGIYPTIIVISRIFSTIRTKEKWKTKTIY